MGFLAASPSTDEKMFLIIVSRNRGDGEWGAERKILQINKSRKGSSPFSGIFPSPPLADAPLSFYVIKCYAEDPMETYQRGCLHLHELEGYQCRSAHSETLQNIKVHGTEFEFQNGKTCSTCRERREENESWNGLSGRRLVCSDAGHGVILDKCRDTSERARNITKDR